MLAECIIYYVYDLNILSTWPVQCAWPFILNVFSNANYYCNDVQSVIDDSRLFKCELTDLFSWLGKYEYEDKYWCTT